MLSITDEVVAGACVIDSQGNRHELPIPSRHIDIIETYRLSNGGALAVKEQGFFTNLGRYVDRKEAMKIAIRSNQLINPDCKDTELSSRHLW